MMIAVVGGGPAGLRAAEVAAQSGAEVLLFDAKPSVGRKFLVAGKGGLNLTHEEPAEEFAARYEGPDQPRGIWTKLLDEFGPEALRYWATTLGTETFVASTGRVYPRDLKAASLLRRWVQRLRSSGVRFLTRHRVTDLIVESAKRIRIEFEHEELAVHYQVDAAVLALGGGSWPETGSDGKWVPILERQEVFVRPLAPANCGWEVNWPAEVLAMAEGQPLKNVAAQAGETRVRGELLITRYGLEGGIVYQLGRVLRAMEEPSLDIDFKPDTSREQLLRKVAGIRVRRWEQARQRWRIPDAVSTLLTCSGGIRPDASMDELASVVKSFPLKLTRPRPLPEAISSAGGVGWQEINEDLMLRRLPGVFVAGEMIDWEAPTGGYLLQGAFATGTRAGLAAARWCST